jgi:hypothetical protein
MADNDDLEDNIFDEGEPHDDGTADVIRKALDEVMPDDDKDDDAGLDLPHEEPTGEEPDVVSPDKGRDLLDDADIAKARGAKPKADDDATKKPDPKDDKPDDDAAPGTDAAKADDEADDGKPKAEDKAPDLTSAGLDALLDGVPDDRRGEISRRLSEADSAMSAFTTPYARQQLERFGAKPAEMASRLVELASFASEKPDEYLAWVAKESAASDDKIPELLSNAAKRFGLKVVPDTPEGDDEDLLADPEVAQLKREKAELERKLNGQDTNFGPDTPERRQQREVQSALQSFIAERGEDGALKRPHFSQLQARIGQIAQAHKVSTGQAVTTANLDQFYTQALQEAQAAFSQGNPAPAPSAAQPAPPVADQKDNTAATAKARNASKSVDGTGQGASRRPVLSPNAPLHEVISHFADGD